MKYNKLGKNLPEVSTIGYGAWGISGRDWGVTDDEVSIKALNKAIDNGLTFIDTADTYGFGHSEDLVAKVIKERNLKNKIVIATKAGNNFYPHVNEQLDTTPANPDYSKKHLIYAAEQSIKRLGVEALDILQLHSPDMEILKRDEPWEALEELKKSGKIKHAGWSVQSFQETNQAVILEEHHDLIDVIQVRYNLMEREAEDTLFPLAEKHGTGVIARIPLLFGLLTGKFDRNSKFSDKDHRRFNLSEENLDKYLSRLDSATDFYKKHDAYSLAQLNLRFCISHPAVSVAIPGMKTSKQVLDNIAASDIEIDFNEFPKI